MKSHLFKHQIKNKSGQSITAFCFTPDGSMIYVGDSDGFLTQYCMKSGGYAVKSLKGFPPTKIISIHTSIDSVCAITNKSAIFQTHSTFDSEDLCTITGSLSVVRDGCFTKDGKHLVLAFSDSLISSKGDEPSRVRSSITLYDIQKRESNILQLMNGIVTRVMIGQEITKLCLHRIICDTSLTGKITSFSYLLKLNGDIKLPSRHILGSQCTNFSTTASKFSNHDQYSCDSNHKGDIIVIAADKLTLWYPDNDGTRDLIPYERAAHRPCCAISRRGATVIASLKGNSIGIWNTITRTQTSVLKVRSSNILSLSISFIGSKIAAGTTDGTVHLWTMPAKEYVQSTLITPAPSAPSLPDIDLKNPSKPKRSQQIPEYVQSAPITPAPSAPSSSHIDLTNSSKPEQHQQIQQAKHFSPIEDAFTQALLHISHPTSILDEPFLLKYITPNNMHSPSDLIAAHNLVLLAIRSGVITRQNVRCFGNIEWFFETNLYLPATKIHSNQHDIFNKIFFHAEKIGIIQNGFVLKVAREIRLNVTADVNSVGKIMKRLALRIGDIQRRLENIEGDMGTLEHATKQLYHTTDALSNNQKRMQQNISTLSNNLTKLEKYIRDNQRRQKYATIAKCSLSLIPIIGNLIGNAASAAFEIIGEMSSKDIIAGDLDIGKELIDIPFGVDLSNLQTLRYGLSETCLSKLPSSAQQAVVSGVENSSFRCLDNLQTVLTRYLLSEEYKVDKIISIDIGSQHWLTDKFASRSPSTRIDENELERNARIHFQFITRSLPNGDKYLPVDESMKSLNEVLQECCGYETVDDQKVEDVFFEITEDDEDMVSEEVFVKMFLHIRKAQDEQQRVGRQLDVLKERFQSRASSGLLSLRMACRVMVKFGKDLVEEKMIAVDRVPCVEEVESVLRRHDGDKNEKIDEEEFIAAAQYLFYSRG